MVTLKTFKYRSVTVKIVRDQVGTGYKLGNARAVWLDVDSSTVAENKAKEAIDKHFG